MKLYLISQDVNNGYDTYDSAVVCAKSPTAAKHISPSEYDYWHKDAWYFKYRDGRVEDTPSGGTSWAHPTKVTAVCIGEANSKVKEGEVICASFNAG